MRRETKAGVDLGTRAPIEEERIRVAYAVVQDVSSTWEQYERITASLVEPAPIGLILHVAGPTDEGFRIINVWESEEAWQHFQTERLAPAIAALGGPARPEPSFRDLHPVHVVVGRLPAPHRAGQTRETRRHRGRD
jgi:quinol monooxygenase YgiN